MGNQTSTKGYILLDNFHINQKFLSSETQGERLTVQVRYLHARARE